MESNRTSARFKNNQYPVQASATPRLSHTSVPITGSEAVLTNKARTTMTRKDVTAYRHFATKDGEILEGARIHTTVQAVAVSYDVNKTDSVMPASIGQGASYSVVSQRFDINNAQLTEVQLYVRKSGTVAGSWYLRIYNGSTLLASVQMDVSVLTDSYQWFTFDTTSLGLGTLNTDNLRIGISYESINQVQVSVGNDSLPYGYQYATSATTPSWESGSSADLTIRIKVNPTVYTRQARNGSFISAQSSGISSIAKDDDVTNIITGDYFDSYAFIEQPLTGGTTRQYQITAFQIRYDPVQVKGAATYSIP